MRGFLILLCLAGFALAQVRFVRVLDAPDYAYGRAIAAMPDGGFAVAGETSGGPGLWDMIVSRFDSSGNQLWTRALGGMGYAHVYVQDVLATTGGDILVVGAAQPASDTTDDALVSRFDSSGNHL